MLIYSIVPPEVVFSRDGETRPRVWEEMESDGARRVLVRRDGDGRAVIERIISTEPRDYLDPALQPGRPYGAGPRR